MTGSSRPIEGITIVEICVNVPGPLAGARLPKLGATVIKIEPPSGDPLRRVAPHWYEELCADTQVERLDLKDGPGRRQLDQLLDGADVLLTASRPQSLARLGLGWEALHARFPRLCQVAIVGFRAPATDQPGHDLTYQAVAGLLEPGGTGALPRSLIADLGGAERAVSAVLGLLLARERMGVAGYAEVALADVALAFAAPLRHGLTAPGGWLGGGYPPYNRYATADGWIAIAALEPQFWQSFVQAVERPDLADARAAGTAQALETLFRLRTTEAWLQLAREHDLPLAAIAGAYGESAQQADSGVSPGDG